jgi:GT2 family glycosyltransferase
MSAAPDAAIVIVNYRSAELVERCLASVREGSGDLRFETVIVDNDSGDGSVERLSHSLPEARVIAMGANRGFAAGVNAGFANSRADLVILLNPDTEVRAGAIELLLERLGEHPATGVVAPLLEDEEGTLMSNGMRRFPNLLTMALAFSVPASYGFVYLPFEHFEAMSAEDHLAGRAPVHVCGAALAIRRASYEQAGPFDEGFFLYLEETEWQGRVTAAGWNIELVPGARVCHFVRGGGQEALAPSPYVVRSALRYLRLKGVPMWLSRAVLGLSMLSSVVTLRLIACMPSKRARATWQAHAYRSLLRELR